MQQNRLYLEWINKNAKKKQVYGQLHLLKMPISPQYTFLISYNLCEIGHESVVSLGIAPN
jgi:hypothetical protein